MQGCQIFLGTIFKHWRKYTKWPQIISNGCKIDQMSIIYSNIFHCKALQNLPKCRFLVSKVYHLATLPKCRKVGQSCRPGRFQAFGTFVHILSIKKFPPKLLVFVPSWRHTSVTVRPDGFVKQLPNMQPK
jgi:hypothetical protein